MSRSHEFDTASGRGQRQDRSAKREEKARTRTSRAATLSRPKPSPLPPHPEGLKPPIWPPLLMLVAFALLFWRLLYGAVAIAVVLVYATATRNDRKRHLLYAYIQGRRQFSAGDYEAALANFTDIEEADFAPPAVLRALGLTYYHLGRWAEAATYLEDVPDRGPDEDATLAHALVELGEEAEALEVLDGAERPAPLGGVVRAVVDLRRGKAGAAAAALDAVLAEAGGEEAPPEEPFLGARYWLGVARKAAGDEKGSREAFERLYEIDPSYHDVAAVLGRPGPGE